MPSVWIPAIMASQPISRRFASQGVIFMVVFPSSKVFERSTACAVASRPERPWMAKAVELSSDFGKSRWGAFQHERVAYSTER